MIWTLPQIDEQLTGVCNELNVTMINTISVVDDIMASYDNCHENVSNYVLYNGGSSVLGSYVVKHVALPIFQFIKHSVWFDGERYIDITPYKDNRQTTVFVDYVPPNDNKLVDYSKTEISTSLPDALFYVYVYIDPNTHQPLYVGKGTGNRSTYHLLNTSKISNKRFRNKLNSMKRKRLEPDIELLVEEIEDEQMAYELEEHFISMFGRKGYDKNGILLNICKSNRPPNHKGKTYKEIYGSDWRGVIEKRRELQLAAGGYGPKHHTAETRRKISEAQLGEKNHMWGNHHTTQTREKISKANKGRRRANANTYILYYKNIKQISMVGTTDVIQYCSNNNISWSTLYKRAMDGLLVGSVTKGKTKHWELQIIKRSD